MSIRVEKDGDRWLVVGGQGLEGRWLELDWAVWSALEFSAILRLGEPKLGEGVPPDALERGQQLKAVMDAHRARLNSVERPPLRLNGNLRT